MVDLMYKSIAQYRLSALYSAWMSMDSYLPADMKLQSAITEQTKGTLIDHIEGVKAATGKDVVLVGTRTAIQALQSTVPYAIWSGNMKDEQNQKGILGMWEGYECIVLDRVNVAGTRTSVFTADDNKKIFIMPVDGDFKPIKRVNEGDVEYVERGFDGTFTQDRTIEAAVWYKEGVGVVINQLFGEIYNNA